MKHLEHGILESRSVGFWMIIYVSSNRRPLNACFIFRREKYFRKYNREVPLEYSSCLKTLRRRGRVIQNPVLLLIGLLKNRPKVQKAAVLGNFFTFPRNLISLLFNWRNISTFLYLCVITFAIFLFYSTRYAVKIQILVVIDFNIHHFGWHTLSKN